MADHTPLQDFLNTVDDRGTLEFDPDAVPSAQEAPSPTPKQPTTTDTPHAHNR